MIIGSDIDGVAFDFSKGFGEYLVSSGLYPDFSAHLSDTPVYITHNELGCTKEEIAEIINHAVDEGHLFTGPPMPGAVEAFQKIKSLGHELHFITDRRWGTNPKTSQELTYAWLHEYDIPYDSVTFGPDKTVVPARYFVEDLVKNYDSFAGTKTMCFLINREWNKPHNDHRRRISSISDYADIIELVTKLNSRLTLVHNLLYNSNGVNNANLYI